MCALLLLSVFGCQESKAPEPARGAEAREALDGFLTALQYGDFDGVYFGHIESTPLGYWCASESFSQVLEATREARTDAECERARKITDAQGLEIDDQTALLVQTMRFVCEQPQGRCHDYARRVMKSTVESSPYWATRLQGWTVHKFLPKGDDAATAYIDLMYPAPVGTQRETLELRKTPLGWRVSAGLF